MSQPPNGHDLNRRRLEALGEAVLAAELAELATRWVAQTRNLGGASRLGELDPTDKRVHLELASWLAADATDAATDAGIAAAKGHGNQAHELREQVVALEQRVRMHCSRAGLRVQNGDRPMPTGVLYLREMLPDWPCSS